MAEIYHKPCFILFFTVNFVVKKNIAIKNAQRMFCQQNEQEILIKNRVVGVDKDKAI